MKKLVLGICIILLILATGFTLSSCDDEKTDSDPEPSLDIFGDGATSSRNVEVGKISVKYLKQNDYNDGDFSEDKLADEPYFSKEEPYCYMVLDFTYKALETANSGRFEVEFDIAERGFLGMRLEEAATAKFDETVNLDGATLSLYLSVPQVEDGEKSERVILRLAPISVGTATVNVFIDDRFGYKKSVDVVDSCSLFSFELNENGRSYTLTRFRSDWVTEVDVPRNLGDGMPVTAIAGGAFEGKYKLQQISIPDTVVTVGPRAFSECYALGDVELPSVTSVGGKAFFKCYSLRSVKMPKAAKIAESAFEYCEKLTSVEMPLVTEIGNWAFYGCELLRSVGNLMPAKIGDYAFHDCTALTAINLSSAKEIGKSAFGGCIGLASVDLSSATTIGDEAFYGCDGITSVDLSSAITVGEKAFGDCNGLINARVSDSVKNISMGVFSGCTALQYQTYENAKYLGNDSNPYLVLMKVIDTQAESFLVHESAKIIAGGAFSGYSGLQAIRLPASVDRIGDGAFSNCSALTVIEMPAVTEIGNSAFQNCVELTNIVLPSCLLQIGKKAFYGCIGLTSLEIPTSVTSIGEGAFVKCSALERITLPFLSHKLIYLFQYVTYFEFDPTISDTEGEIPKGLHTVEIQSGDIPDYAFDGCVNLTTVIILSDWGEIGRYAFRNCSSLNSVTLSASLTSIGEYAFYGCESLQEIQFQGTEYQWRDMRCGWYWYENSAIARIVCSDGTVELK